MKLIKAILLTILTTSFAGCINEDSSNCKDCDNIAFNFDYHNFPEKIIRVNIGFFDANGNLVESRQVDKNELADFQGVKTDLEPGSYTAICWGNAFEKTFIRGFGSDSKLKDGLVTHPYLGLSQPITGNDSLFYASLKFNIPESGGYTGDIKFKMAYIRFKICVQGLYSTSIGEPPVNYPYIRINDLKPVYDFEMQAIGNPVSYYPQVVVDTEERKAMSQCDVFRFKQDNDITIDILNNITENKVIHTVDVKQFINENNIVITDDNEVVIPILITFDEEGASITIKVSKWEENIIIPEL